MHTAHTFLIDCLSWRHQMYDRDWQTICSISSAIRPYYIQSWSLESKTTTEPTPSIAINVAVKICPGTVFQMTTLAVCCRKSAWVIWRSFSE